VLLSMPCCAVPCCVGQNSEISRLQSQLQSAGGQRQQLEQQMAALTQQMSNAVASFMQQQVGREEGLGALSHVTYMVSVALGSCNTWPSCLQLAAWYVLSGSENLQA
jgi:hypothetical protein